MSMGDMSIDSGDDASMEADTATPPEEPAPEQPSATK